MKRVLLTGGSGTLGVELMALLQERGAKVLAPRSAMLDIRNATAVRDYFYVRRDMFDVVIHAAAYTNVMGSERDFADCMQVNVSGTLNVGLACAEHQKKLVYISTDHVFDGERGNYSPSDPINPLTAYAKSKAAGELVARTIPGSLVVRTSFYGHQFPYPKAVTDQWTTKDYVDVMAPKILEACLSDRVGIVHIASRKRSVYELALERRPDVLAIQRADLKFPTPKDSSLAS